MQSPPIARADRRRAPRNLKRRRRALLGVIAGCVLCTGGGVGAAMVIKSPAQAAAEMAPPPMDILTAPVERKVLSQSVVTRGTVVASQRLVAGAPGPIDKGVGRSIVTNVKVKPGQELKMGQLLVEVSGRPVFVLHGDLPAYRDLASGMRGDDVEQLQKALAAVGYPTGNDTLGVFGVGTQKAVTSFYRAHDYDPATIESATSPEGTDEASEDVSTTTPMLPLSEVVYVRSLPAHVEDVKAEAGSEAGEDLVSISSGSLMVDGRLAPHERGMVRPGQTVHIFSELTGFQGTGTVVSVAKSPAKPQEGEKQPQGESYAVKIKPSKRLPYDLVGEDVQLTIDAASSKTKVLAVPVSAISAGADGRTTVTIRQGSKEQRISVRTGMTADGFVEVTPETAGTLSPRQQVIVGVEASGSASGR